MSLKQEMAAAYPVKEGFKMKASGVGCVSSSTSKWKFALILGVIFLILSAPMITKGLGDLIAKMSGKSIEMYSMDGPTSTGLLIQAAVFILVARLMMK